MIGIENTELSVAISLKGAELQSIRKKQSGEELLWQGDPAWWPRKAPILFPVVGKLKNDSYTFEGRTYRMPQHGIARDMNFTLISSSQDRCSMYLESDEESLQLYPFHFRLEAVYSLEGKQLGCAYTVKNTGSSDMYFSLGMHPGFNCHMDEDLHLRLEQEEQLPRWLLKDGLYSGETEPLLDGKELVLSDELFTKDAIVWKHPRSAYAELYSEKKRSGIRVHMKGWPYLGIWKKPGAGFLCIEPWHGLADFQSHQGALKEKEGIRMLRSSETFETTYSIEIR